MENIKVAILLPTLGRHVRLGWIVDNIHRSNEFGPTINIYFLLEDNDAESIAEVKAIMNNREFVKMIVCPFRNINKAINYGFHKTNEPYVYIACDDLEFTPGWLTSCLSLMNKQIRVVGTWDGFTDRGKETVFGNSGYLIDRSYIDQMSGVVDKPGMIYNEDYHHFYADTEFFYTSCFRGVFAHNRHATVVHQHYSISDLWGAKRDKTAELNENQELCVRDKAIYNKRVCLFGAPYEP